MCKLLALPLALLALLLGAGAAEAAPISWHPPSGSYSHPTVGDGGHACIVLGTHGSHQAVTCAELKGAVVQVSATHFDVYVRGGNQVFCQTTGGALEQCQGIKETAGTCDAAGCLEAPGVCGAIYGHSACGVRRVSNNAPQVSYAKTARGQLTPAVWGRSQNVTVVLPDGASFSGSVKTNDYYFVC